MSNSQPPANDPMGMFGGGFGTPPGAREFPPRPGGPPEPPPKKSRRSGKKGGRKDKAPRTSTTRLLNKQRVFALVFAVLAGVLAFAVTAEEVEQTFVIRTTAAIPALSSIANTQVEAVALPLEAVEDGAIVADTAEGALEKVSLLLSEGRVRMALPKGHQLHLEDFTADAELTVPLGPDERVFALEASVVNAVGGQLRAGDRVDIVGVTEFEGNVYSNIIATDIEILSALPGEQQFNAVAQSQVSSNRDESGSSLLPSDPVPGIYNMRVSVSDAISLANVASRGDLVLVLRGKSAQDSPTAPAQLDLVITSPDSPSSAPATPAAASLGGE